jgi:hypothetical protein
MMFKLVLVALGVVGGAAGSASWLLSESDAPLSSTALPERLQLLKTRFAAAWAEGSIAGQDTENRVRHELDTYRLHPDRPATSQ